MTTRTDRLNATRAAIIADQATNAKRSVKALKAEAKWFRNAAADARKAGNLAAAAKADEAAADLEAQF